MGSRYMALGRASSPRRHGRKMSKAASLILASRARRRDRALRPVLYERARGQHL
jgi:hypothetical protein